MEAFLVVAVMAMDHLPVHLTDSIQSAREYAQQLAASDGTLIRTLCERLKLPQSPWDGDVLICTYRDGMLDAVEGLPPGS